MQRFLIAIFLLASPEVFALVEFPGSPAPTQAECLLAADSIVLQNEVIRQTWSLKGNSLAPAGLTDKLSATSIAFQGSEVFEYETGATVYKGSAFAIVARPAACSTVAAKGAADIKIANRFGGKAVSLRLRSADGKLHVLWSATLLDGSNYVRQSVRVTNKGGAPVLIRKSTFLRQNALAPVYQGNPKGAQVAETGDGRGYGSTIGDGNFFFGLEAPYSSNLIGTAGGRPEISFFFPSVNPLPADSSNSKGLVTGVAPAGQMRRAFLYYLSRERAHYYRMFPHYDAWYDLTYSYHKDSLLDRIQVFGRELGQKRNFHLKAFQPDDGWDDPGRGPAWMHFNRTNLPQGFSLLKDSAAKYQAGMGIWFGVGGGYSYRDARIAASPGIETLRSTTDRNAPPYLNMAGPNYFSMAVNAFKDKILNHGVKVIKYDVMLLHAPDTAFYEHMDAVGRFNDIMRGIDPDIFLKGMGGSLPSPFYLLTFDAYWRGGNGDAGNHVTPWSGNNSRETWINRRDVVAQDAITNYSTVCPLNSIAVHGITIGTQLYPKDWPRDLTSVKHEVRSFFGIGSQVQDLLISPSYMTPEIYDAIAEAGIWAKANEDIMEDTHWVGGNIRNGDVYGYAGWNRRGGVLSLRNPRTTAQSISLDIGKVFELPPGASRTYELKSPWKEDASKVPLVLVAGAPQSLTLQALETLQFNARPLDAVSIRNRNLDPAGPVGRAEWRRVRGAMRVKSRIGRVYSTDGKVSR